MAQPDTHRYQTALGHPELRAEFATAEGLDPAQVAITAGCNQAFAIALQCLYRPGAEVVVPTPYYFNHQMTLQMHGFNPVAWPCLDTMRLDLTALEALITERTTAVVLVTPNNPTGQVASTEELESLYAICQDRGIALILDETYKDFIPPAQRPTLHHKPDWDQTLVRLYSFSKAFAIAGHRVGALCASPQLLAEAEKVIDCWSICAPRLGQELALEGLRNSQAWVAEKSALMAQRCRHLHAVFEPLTEIEIITSGAYFAWIKVEGPLEGRELALDWVRRLGILALPGEFFGVSGPYLRLAFANLDEAQLTTLAKRLAHGL